MGKRLISDTAIFYGDKQNNDDYDNGVWMKVLDIPFIQKIEEAALYQTIIRTLWVEASGWSKSIRDEHPHIIQIGLSDHPLSTHIAKLDALTQHAYLSDLQYLDGIMVLTEEERQFYSIVIPHIPVERVGLPFPVESYETRYGSFRNNEKKYIGLGVGASDNDRNFISNLMVFQQLQLKNPDLVGVFLSIPHQLMPYCSYWSDKFSNVYIHQRNGMDEMYEMLSQCKLVINLADRNTPGRLQGEAAFLDIPVVGSNRFELQEELFPQWSVKPYDLEAAVEHAQWILDHPADATTLAQTAHETLVTNYSYEKSRDRYNSLLKRVAERG